MSSPTLLFRTALKSRSLLAPTRISIVQPSPIPRRLPCTPRSYSTPTPIYVPPANRPFARPGRTLPEVPNRRLPVLLFSLLVVTLGGAFVLHATNRERLSSSVLKNVLERMREDARVREALSGSAAANVGDDEEEGQGEGRVKLERSAWLAGDPWIRGSVNMMQGKVDMSFRLKGAKDSGTAYFTSIRRPSSKSFEILRFLLVLDASGEVISLLDDVDEFDDAKRGGGKEGMGMGTSIGTGNGTGSEGKRSRMIMDSDGELSEVQG